MSYKYYCKGCEGGVVSKDGITFYCGCREEERMLADAYTSRDFKSRPAPKFKNDWGEVGPLVHRGYVYIIKMKGTNMYKIGISSDPYARLSQLQTGNPFKLTVVKKFSNSKPKLLEHIVHVVMADKRKRGEWFELTKQEFSDLVENIKVLKSTLWGE